MSNYRVLLINPPALGVLEPWQDTPEFGRIALAYLASFLRTHAAGFDIAVIDAKLERLDFQQVLARTLAFDPHVVGFTAFTNEIKPAAYQAAKIKQRLPQVVTVIGGAHLTALPTQTLEEFPFFDFGVIGDGEETFTDLCKTLRARQTCEAVDGLAFRSGDTVLTTKPRGRILDQDSIPFPAWDLFPRAKVYWVQSARGCPYNCVFCMNHNGRVARRRSVDNVMQELNWIVDKFDPEWIRFGDELFSVDMPRTMNLLAAMIKAKIGERVKWDVQTHVRFVDYEMFVRFKQANVTQVDMGVETGDEEQLKVLGKGTNRQQICEAFAAARKAGVRTGSFLLFGQPHETVESIRKTIALAVRINADIPMFGMMVPYPGTEVARLAARNEAGYQSLSTNWDEYRKQIGGAVEFANVSRTQAEMLQIAGYLSVFVRNGRYKDLAKFFWNYRTEARNLLFKVLARRKGLKQWSELPPDYDAVLGEGPGPDLEEVARSKGAFEVIQRAEMDRTRRLKPELLAGVRPL